MITEEKSGWMKPVHSRIRQICGILVYIYFSFYCESNIMISEHVTILQVVFQGRCTVKILHSQLPNSCKKETKKGAIHDEEAVSIRKNI